MQIAFEFMLTGIVQLSSAGLHKAPPMERLIREDLGVLFG